MLHHLPSETLSSQRRRIKRDNGVHTFHIRLWFCKHPFHAVKTASETSWKFNNFVAREVFEIAARHTHARATLFLMQVEFLIAKTTRPAVEVSTNSKMRIPTLGADVKKL